MRCLGIRSLVALAFFAAAELRPAVAACTGNNETITTVDLVSYVGYDTSNRHR